MLGPGHVILLEELESILMKALNCLPRKYKISMQSRDIIHGDEKQEESDDQEPQDPVPFNIVRSFIHVRVPSSLYSQPSSGPRTVSTTETCSRKGENPRNSVKRQGYTM